MATPPRNARPQAVLFACGLNSVRSPMADGRLFFTQWDAGLIGEVIPRS